MLLTSKKCTFYALLLRSKKHSTVTSSPPVIRYKIFLQLGKLITNPFRKSLRKPLLLPSRTHYTHYDHDLKLSRGEHVPQNAIKNKKLSKNSQWGRTVDHSTLLLCCHKTPILTRQQNPLLLSSKLQIKLHERRSLPSKTPPLPIGMPNSPNHAASQNTSSNRDMAADGAARILSPLLTKPPVLPRQQLYLRCRGSTNVLTPCYHQILAPRTSAWTPHHR